MVLTDEWNQQTYPMASLEDGGTVNTEDDYYSINTNAIVSNPASLPSTYQNNNGNPPYNNNPTSNTTATSAKMYKLNGNTGDKTGLGITLKVMSGDNVSIFGKSFWHNNGSVNNGYSINVNDLLTSLAGTNAVAGAGKGITAAALTGSPTIPGGVTSWLATAPTTGSNPKAYLNWILFDEQFKPVSTGSNFDPVGNTDVLKTHNQNVSIGRNGYLYVYCSNESNTDVFFDNLQVVHTKSPLVEETHYYPFGLTMSGISSRAAGTTENKKKYNGNGSGLEAYDFNARTYSQQIGRFNQIDPTPEDGDQESLTPYHFSGNNPSTFNDPNGKCPWCLGFVIGALVDYGTQVTGNLLQGKSLSESLTNVDKTQILISAVAGGLSGGASLVLPKGVVGKVAKEVALTTVDAAESVAKQINSGQTVTLKQTASDILSNKLGGKLTDNVNASSIKSAEKSLDRATRVAAQDVTSAGRQAAVKNAESKLVNANGSKQLVGGATNNAIQETSNKVTGAQGTNAKVPLAQPSDRALSDNTKLKPLVLAL